MDVEANCLMGRRNLPQVSANPATGLFIDTQTPASCSGYIRAWDICYYNPRHFNSEERVRNGLPITLQTWRFTEPQNGVRISSYATIVPNPQNSAFQCSTITLPPDQYTRVEVGDVIGVSLTNGAVLPVVGNYQGGGETPRLTMFSRSDLAVVTRQGDVLLSNNVLHVTADIENIGKQCFQHWHVIIMLCQRFISLSAGAFLRFECRYYSQLAADAM